MTEPMDAPAETSGGKQDEAPRLTRRGNPIPEARDPTLVSQGVTAMPVDKVAVLGAVAWMAQFTPYYGQLSLMHLRFRIIPSLCHNQFRLYLHGKTPIGFVNWAMIDARTERLYEDGNYVLSLPEWQCGNRVWLVDVIAPFGHTAMIRRDLAEQVFPDETIIQGMRQHEIGGPWQNRWGTLRRRKSTSAEAASPDAGQPAAAAPPADGS